MHRPQQDAQRRAPQRAGRGEGRRAPRRHECRNYWGSARTRNERGSSGARARRGLGERWGGVSTDRWMTSVRPAVAKRSGRRRWTRAKGPVSERDARYAKARPRGQQQAGNRALSYWSLPNNPSQWANIATDLSDAYRAAAAVAAAAAAAAAETSSLQRNSISDTPSPFFGSKTSRAKMQPRPGAETERS